MAASRQAAGAQARAAMAHTPRRFGSFPRERTHESPIIFPSEHLLPKQRVAGSDSVSRSRYDFVAANRRGSGSGARVRATNDERQYWEHERAAMKA